MRKDRLKKEESMLKRIFCILNICAIAVLCLTLLSACNSKKNAVPEEFRGTYSDIVTGVL